MYTHCNPKLSPRAVSGEIHSDSLPSVSESTRRDGFLTFPQYTDAITYKYTHHHPGPDPWPPVVRQHAVTHQQQKTRTGSKNRGIAHKNRSDEFPKTVLFHCAKMKKKISLTEKMIIFQLRKTDLCTQGGTRTVSINQIVPIGPIQYMSCVSI